MYNNQCLILWSTKKQFSNSESIFLSRPGDRKMVKVTLANFPIVEVPMMTAVPVSKMKTLIWIIISVLTMGS